MSNTFGANSRRNFDDQAGAQEAIPFGQSDTGDRTTNSRPACKHFIHNSTPKTQRTTKIRKPAPGYITFLCGGTLHDKYKWLALRSRNSSRSWRTPKGKSLSQRTCDGVIILLDHSRRGLSRMFLSRDVLQQDRNGHSRSPTSPLGGR
jgi:hypothetical protein